MRRAAAMAAIALAVGACEPVKFVDPCAGVPVSRCPDVPMCHRLPLPHDRQSPKDCQSLSDGHTAVDRSHRGPRPSEPAWRLGESSRPRRTPDCASVECAVRCEEAVERSPLGAYLCRRKSGLCPHRSAGVKMGWSRPPWMGSARGEVPFLTTRTCAPRDRIVGMEAECSALRTGHRGATGFTTP
jgi:hypothetical protein